MQRPMLDWLTENIQTGRALCAHLRRTIGLDMAAMFPSISDPAIDGDPAEQIAVVRLITMKLNELSDDPEGLAALLLVCDAVEADDGSPAALARFNAANARAMLMQSRAQMQRVANLKRTLQSTRPEKGNGVNQPFVCGFLAAIAGNLHIADRTRSIEVPAACSEIPPTEGVELLAWLKARVSVGDEERLAGLLEVVEMDDGSAGAWTSIVTRLKQYAKAIVTEQHEAAMKMYG